MSLIPFRNHQSIAGVVLLIVYAFFVAGCSYYRVKTLDPLNSASIAKAMRDQKKYVILHTHIGDFHLKDVGLNNDKQEISGVIEVLPANHQYYKKAKPHGANRYSHGDYMNPADRPIHEIHIYTDLRMDGLPAQLAIPFSTIRKMEVYDTHAAATIGVWTVTTAAVIVGLAIIIAATKGSCPFVFTGDGETYTFQGEMFGGAIYPQLERDDYMNLPGLQAVDGSYNVRIANELLEKQYINLAELVVVTHPGNTEAIFDKRGNIQTIADPQLPVTALTDTGADYTQQVATSDSILYLFDQENLENPTVSSLTMSFRRPMDSNAGKLVLRAKNSYWLDYVYGKFNELFGMYYNTFAEQQKEEPVEKLTQWSIDQNIPLSVYVKTESGWKLVDYFDSIGPLAWRDIVMPVDLSGVTGDEVTIKLESGFMFWEVDHAAMDFSTNVPVEVTSIAPASAFDENGVGVSDLISATDHKYLLQPEIGNVVTLKFNQPPPTEGVQTAFLHSRGYYEYIRDFKNIPNLIYLNSFKEKGAFTKFSREQFDAFSYDESIVAAALAQRDED